MFGILQFGLTYNRQQGLHAAAREGARLASLGNTVTAAEVRQRVGEAAPAFIIDRTPVTGDIVVTIRNTAGAATDTDFCKDLDADGEIADEQVTVEVDIASGAQSKYNFGLPLLPGPVQPDLSSRATFQCEQVRP